MSEKLRAPMPYFGGKSRIADLVWQRFGRVSNYVEPFAGSLAILLGCPHPGHTETVNDIDALLANFWRAHGGYGSQGDGRGRENANREIVAFSPHCIDPAADWTQAIKASDSDWRGTLFEEDV